VQIELKHLCVSQSENFYDINNPVDSCVTLYKFDFKMYHTGTLLTQFSITLPMTFL